MAPAFLTFPCEINALAASKVGSLLCSIWPRLGPNNHLLFLKSNGIVADVNTSMLQFIHTTGELEIDLARRELRTRGVPVPIGGRAFEVLEVLVQAGGELVTKGDLMKHVWPGA